MEDPEPAETTRISKKQIAFFMHIAGDEPNDIFAQLEVLDDKSLKHLMNVLNMFDTYCNSRKNKLYEWDAFWTILQFSGEPIDANLKIFRSQALKCDFLVEYKPKTL